MSIIYFIGVVALLYGAVVLVSVVWFGLWAWIVSK
jgi:hypothetical protein